MVAQSATLSANERLEARRVDSEPLHLGLGEARLPVPATVARFLADAAPRNRYGPVAGSFTARGAAAAYFTRRGLATEAEQIVLAPGSKPLLYALVASVPGDVILPRPSWVSYAAQATLAHKRLVWVNVPDSAGGVPDPDQLASVLARRSGARQPGLMILTLPDNPTGTLAQRDLVAQACEVAAEHEITVVADEIYRDLCYLPETFTSPVEFLPESCVITSGLSKSMALGGWRVGFARFPSSSRGQLLRQDVIGLASEVWSSLAEPLQVAATHVLHEPAEVTEHVEASRRLHRCVAAAAHEEFVRAGADCLPPQGAFYLYPDFADLRPALAQRGITTGAALAEHLLERHGVGVLAGEAFGDDPAELRFRAATSLLYGHTDDERWAALRSPNPVGLPWIAAALARLRACLQALTAG